MDKQPSIDRGLLVPIGIGVFSILGIVVALLIVYLDKPETVIAEPTATQFKFILLATETLVPDPALETPALEEIFPEPSIDPILIDTQPTGFPTSLSTLSSQFKPTLSSTLQSLTATPSSTGDTTILNVTERYDDADPLLDYAGDWENQTNVGTAYDGTLVVSNTIGNDVIFDFTGQKLIVGYLGQPGLGSISISIDDIEFHHNQSVGKEWVSPQLDDAEHFVLIAHESGDSINLDYIDILSSN